MSLFRDFVSIFYPKICMSCGIILNSDEEVICLDCSSSLTETNFHLYRDNPLEKLFWGKVQLESAVAYYYYSKKSKIQNVIFKLKYKGHTEIGIYLGKEYGKILKNLEFYKAVDLIIPVPLHKEKHRQRGYNQSEYFAKGLSISMNIPINSSVLFRIKPSETQTKKKRYERWENVKEIFIIKNSDELTGKHILLVDDVITTGATIESSVKVLLKIQGIKISIASIAFAGG